ncbi:Murein L,D-transpeptidase YcbB/YkuD [Nitrosomonas aestuarii]|uniref:Murein L,D-transpeptidase YcbB/YkuD n=1 Tax=Nitrosomonas aestuarii TaxID=52441 RepID=A0A1I4EL96_9PROT|nr:L,D-transpeptidase family protein [Nitrosomonas aestuarii]SFL06508.1 Murein L,D-transpeptidase YcbB/YkuD [Nitrosomonas aestuarii]
MKQFIRFLPFFSGLYFLLFTASAFALTPTSRTLSQEFENFLSQHATNDDTEKHQIIALQQFYAARNYQPAWINSSSQQSRIETILSFIASADDEGLDSHNYRLQQLLLLATENSSLSRYELEFRTTLTLLQYAHDLYRGRFTASEIDPDWHIPQPDFDSVGFLLRTASSNNLQQSLESIAPNIPSYQLFKKALAKYRELVTNQISWQQIPNVSLLRPDDSHPVIPLIRTRITQAYETHGKIEYHLVSSEESKKSNRYDINLVRAIKAFQLQHGLNADGIIGKNTLNALNKTPSEKIQQLRISMERLRWLPRDLGDRYLLVNIAGFQLAAVENDQNIFDMRIIVGRNYRSTPSFHSRITHMIVNPYWNIPASIARKDLLPKQQQDPGYFNSQKIRVYPDYNYSSAPIDPNTIDWRAIKNRFPYALRQEPGILNALGSIKFMLPNHFSIYLHDTPSKALFNREIRTFSSGCIRLEKPLLLAEFALRTSTSAEKINEQINTGRTVQINLPEPLPTYIVYLTAWVDSQHTIHYSPDSYGRDRYALKFARW